MASKSPLQQHGGGRTWALRVVIVAMIAISGYLTFEYGRISAGYNTVDAANERDSLQTRISMLNDQIVALKQEIALSETHRDVDRAAYKEVEGSLMALQEKIQEQQNALAFYRGIVSPVDGNSGLRVQDLKLTRGRNELEFDIRLVLVQAMKHDRKVSGDIIFSVVGNQNGAPKTLEFADLVVGQGDSSWAFSFRYFQDFDRHVRLPDGFTPESVKVEVRSRTRSISSIEESFDWATIQS